jgi:iron complex outermembrane receptor protein
MGLEGSVSVRAGARHRLTAGGEFRDHPKLSGTFGYPDFPPLERLRSDSRDWGVFIQDEFAPTDRVALHLGLRYDDFDSFGSSINPRAAVILKPSARASVKLLHSEAFRAPNASELSLGGASNPDLDPEEIRLHGVIYEHYLRGHLRLVGNLFKYRIAALIGRTGTVAENLDTIDAEGAEVEVERRWPRGAGLRLSYAYQRARDRATDARLSNSPAHLAKLDLDLPVRGERLSLGAELQYVSDRLTLAGNETDGFLLANVPLFGRGLAPGLDLSASILNLLDADYADPGADFHLQEDIPQNGRNVRLKLTWRF